MRGLFKKAMLLLFLLVQTALFAKDLQQEIRKAEVGDFVVYGYKQQITLLRIASNNGKELVVEEISIQNPEKKKWQEWLSSGAPGHSSWTISALSIEKGSIDFIYSVDEKAYISKPITFQFLPTLLTVSLQPIAPTERKYIGAEPMAGEMDFRRLWLPKIIFEEKEIKAQIEVFRLFWPQDDSELSGKPLDLYIPSNEAITYLPYWIEISAGLTKIKIGVIDSGKKLISPVSTAGK